MTSSGPLSQEDLGHRAQTRHDVLLEISEKIVSHRQLSTLIEELAQSLSRLVVFDVVSVSLYHPERGSTKLHLLTTSEVKRPPIGRELPLHESPTHLVLQTLAPFYVPDVEHSDRYHLLCSFLHEYGIRSYCTLPLYTAQRKVGSLSLGSKQVASYTEEDLEFLQQVARLVSVAVDNALNHEDLARERDRLQALLEINNAVVTHLDERVLFDSITMSLRNHFDADYVSLSVLDPETNQLVLRMLNFPTGKGLIREGAVIGADGTPAGLAVRTGQPQLFTREQMEHFIGPVRDHLLGEGLCSLCALPLISRRRVLGTLNLGSRKDGTLTPEMVPMVMQAATQIAIALDNALAYQRVEHLNTRLSEEKLYLEDEIRTNSQFEEIIGESAPLRRVLKQIETVAPTDSTVILYGETGTGKELLARAIHDLSERRRGTFVKLNCAAIPTGLLESELFGHEKGAFTGAISQRIGRFELAHHGTIFLDEVGEIPLELQPKLLRVLQEREFERLGSSRTLRSDARMVAATNRDLSRMVEDRTFRADLYYRLNVFPIHVPPLRERREDIPMLVSYFAQQFARRMSKGITSIPSDAMNVLVNYAWPGNVRELQNFVERAVILTVGEALALPVQELRGGLTLAPSVASFSSSSAPGSDGVVTLAEAEREAILRALKESQGKIGGAQGAAAKLGMKRTTLQSRMKKLGIPSRPDA